jgi:ABC-type transport system substrate-binding protein
MNSAVPPFDNQKVRQAVQHAINKGNIAKALFYGNYVLGAGPIHPSLQGYDESLASTYPYDPEKAKQLLADAGMSSGLQFEVLTRSEGIWPLEVQLVQSDLAAIGANVSVRQLDSAAFYDEINASKPGIFLNDWVYDTGDPDNIMFSVFSSPRARSRLGYTDTELDQLTLAAQTERDTAKRTDLYKQGQKILLRDSPMVFLGYPARVMGAKKGISNLKISPIGSLPLGGVTVG